METLGVQLIMIIVAILICQISQALQAFTWTTFLRKTAITTTTTTTAATTTTTTVTQTNLRRAMCWLSNNVYLLPLTGSPQATMPKFLFDENSIQVSQPWHTEWSVMYVLFYVQPLNHFECLCEVLNSTQLNIYVCGKFQHSKTEEKNGSRAFYWHDWIDGRFIHERLL